MTQFFFCSAWAQCRTGVQLKHIFNNNGTHELCQLTKRLSISRLKA